MATKNPTALKAWRNVTLSLGLVNVGVSLGSLMQSHQPSGHVVCAEHKTRVTQPYCCEACDGKPAETAKAYDHGGELVELDDSDVALCEKSPDNTVTLTGYVDAHAIDPVWFDKSYLVWPQRNMGQAYSMLVAALRDGCMALVGTTTLTKTTRTFILRWSHATETLVAHLCYFGANLRQRDVALVRGITDAQDNPTDEGIDLIETLFGTLDPEFDPYAVEDEYTEALMAAIAAKATGIAPAAPVAHNRTGPSDADIMAALRAAVDAKQAEKAAAAA